MASLVPAPGEVQDLAVGIQLQLSDGAVADSHRPRSAVAVQVELLLEEAALSPDPEDDLKILGVTGGAAHDETAKAVRLALAAQLGQRPCTHARVAHPAVAVVPVALPAKRLRQ